ncbi:hypothetical protein O3P69_003001 [Scylla paramamosain]|uniref:Uncharacterized protein n=1 Tax=Scylla paramamosain TaxID=85552 RepID=A0AAW0UIP1_SCYPA
MESTLALWITDLWKKNIPLDSKVICEKARKLYERFTAQGTEDSKETQEPEEFLGSKGQFDQYQKLADSEGAKKYQEMFQQEHGHKLKQAKQYLSDKGLEFKVLLLLDNAVNNSVKLAKILCGEGFADIMPKDVNGLNDAHSENLTDKDLAELTKSASKDEDKDPPQEEEEEEEALTFEHLSVKVRAANNLLQMVQKCDPYMICAARFSNAINTPILLYRNLLNAMKKQCQQLPITMFFKKTPPKTPAAAASDEEAPSVEL